MVIYLDIILLENLIVNFFILVITSQVLRLKLKIGYGIIASILASCYCVVLLIPKLKFLSYFPFKILFPCIIIAITFRKTNVMFNIKAAVIYIALSMLLAGMCIFLKYSFNFYNLKILILAIIITYIIVFRLIVYIRDRKEVIQLIYQVDIVIGERIKRVNAFLDTGNELREPATNLPVMVVEKEIFQDINLSKYEKLYIPYKGVNGNCGKFIGFMPEQVLINTIKGVESRKVIIAFCETKLNFLTDYQALLSRGII